MSWLFSFWIFLAPFSLFASIESISSLTEINISELKDHKALAIFDIDDTLTVLHEPAFQSVNFKQVHAGIFTKIMLSLSFDEKWTAFTLPLIMTPGDLIEEEAPAIIQKLQDSGIKTLALTAAPCGRIDGVLLEDSRFYELLRVGIDFSGSFPDILETQFTHFPKPIIGSFPLYKNGIIFSNDTDKGQVLIEFLKNISWSPEFVIFVDDRIQHLYAVEKALALFNPKIQFKGYHFKSNGSCYQVTDAEDFTNKWTEAIDYAKRVLHLEAA